ncbi:IPT/TIG domain-containing protein, partial [Pontibacter sp. H259]|uniref:IPT/TIG domain-containing protein n=1 Tax=Pontibacter sp. H259 TaxID=3133421 RepID=UPI0030BAAD15
MARFYPLPYKSTLIRTLLVNMLLLFAVVLSSQAQSAPTISSFSPTSGTVGTEVTINGSGFDDVHTVNI